MATSSQYGIRNTIYRIRKPRSSPTSPRGSFQKYLKIANYNFQTCLPAGMVLNSYRISTLSPTSHLHVQLRAYTQHMFTVLNQFFLFLTFLGNYSLVWLCLAMIAAHRQRNHATRLLTGTATAVILSFLATEALKFTFHMQRPSYYLLNSEYCPTDFSFPSGHTATSFAAGLVLSHLDPKRRWFYLILATLIAYSRIYLHCHRPIDIIGGFIVGAIISAIVLKTLRTKRATLAKHRKTH